MKLGDSVENWMILSEKSPTGVAILNQSESNHRLSSSSLLSLKHNAKKEQSDKIKNWF